MGRAEARFPREHLRKLVDGLVVFPRVVQRFPQIEVDDERVGIEPPRRLQLVDGFLVTAQVRQEFAIPLPPGGVVGFQLQRPAEVALSAGEIPIEIKMDFRQRDVGLSQCRREGQRLLRRLSSSRERCLRNVKSIQRQQQIAVRQSRIGLGVVRIRRNRLLKVTDGFLKLTLRSPVPRQAAQRV